MVPLPVGMTTAIRLPLIIGGVELWIVHLRPAYNEEKTLEGNQLTARNLTTVIP